MLAQLPVWFIVLIPVAAMLYASVGHGGASAYLALLSLANADTEVMRPTALILNLFVAGISFLYFWKKDYFRWNLFYPFAITSIPAAFLGGYLEVDALFYKKILGVLLLFSVAKLMGWIGKGNEAEKSPIFWQCLIIGALIGFFSGLIGIGGGIILSPVILLLHWANMKETAAVSALFIWINSLAGISGLFLHGFNLDSSAWWLVLLAIGGGLTGSYLGSSIFKQVFLKKVLAIVLLMASFKLLIAP